LSWANYKDLEIEMPPMEITDEDIAKALEETRERAAAFSPVEAGQWRTTTSCN